MIQEFKISKLPILAKFDLCRLALTGTSQKVDQKADHMIEINFFPS